MAKEDVKKFYKELAENKELQEKIEKEQKSYTGDKEDREAAAEAILLPIAKEAGYDFTVEELQAAEREMAEEKGISEEELENVSGGGGVKGQISVGCTFLGVGDGVHAAICFNSGVGTDKEGGGFVICLFLGVGIGGMNY